MFLFLGFRKATIATTNCVWYGWGREVLERETTEGEASIKLGLKSSLTPKPCTFVANSTAQPRLRELS